ncbi:hypothetical protein V6N13_023281 [Hibiscus sabdariffa]
MTCILSFNKWEAREGVISLFVENLPERLHWKGFWFAFARHGDVMSVYIARRRSRGGKRFGFVRMKNSEEADRVIQRLNGATLYGSRLVVKIARDKQGQSWERNTTGKSHSTDYKKIGIGMEDEAVVQKVRTRVSTEVDIGDINVQRLGAKMYLLTIMDEELSQLLEDVNWSYLKEIFDDVIPWSEKTSYSEIATWLEIRGLPLHCWNSVSLKKVAELWGVFEALGENDKHSLDCEKASVLISTKQVKRIDEVIEVEIGDTVFQVGVKEIGFNDGTSYPLCNQWKKEEKSCEKLDESVSESISDLKSVSEHKSHEAVKVDRSCSAELLGGVPKDEKLTAFHENGVEESIKKDSTLDLVEKVTAGNYVGIQRVFSVENAGQVNTKAVGPDNGPIVSSWANMLDETLNSGKGFIRSDYGKALSYGENEKDFFAELETRKGKKRGKASKKFGSLLELQNKSITASDRMKRDKALNSRKWSKLSLEETELSGKSLSDSDIKSRVSMLVKEAKQVLNLGLCLLNFTAAQSLRSITSIDCWTAFAPLLVNVICCPQQHATLVILVGQSSNETGVLALNRTFAEPCLSDIEQVLTGQGAGEDLWHICSTHPSNLTVSFLFRVKRSIP